MDRLEKIWRPVKGFEGSYHISNYGEVKSLGRQILFKRYNPKLKRWHRERIMKPSVTKQGYLKVQLFDNCDYTIKAVAHLVWDAFGDKPRDGHRLQVDHKDGDCANNRIDNLQLLTNRANTSKGWRQNGKKLPTGVSWDKSKGRYVTSIRIDGHNYHLGRYKTAELASAVYQNKLKQIGE
jgi:hypothetical protein